MVAGCELVRADDVQHCDKVAALRGGPGMWIDLPLFVFATPVPVRDCARLERTFYLMPVIGALNKPVGRWTYKRKIREMLLGGRASQVRRRRPPKQLCQRTGPAAAGGALVPTVFEGPVGGVSTDLCSILWQCQAGGLGDIAIRVVRGSISATNWTTLVRRFGDSRVRLDWGAGYISGTLRELGMLLATSTLPRPRAFVISVTRLQVTDRVAARGGALATADWLGRHPGASRGMRELSFIETERVWSACRGIGDIRVRDRARGELARTTRAVYGVSLDTRVQLKIPPMGRAMARILQLAAKRLLRALPWQGMSRRLVRRMRVTVTASTTVGGILCNHRPACAAFDPTIPFGCA